MNRNVILSLVLAGAVSHACPAQVHDTFLTEQVFLAPDKAVYYSGDSIRIDGAVTCLDSNGALPFSRYVNVELVLADSVVERQKVACRDGGRFAAVLPTDGLIPGAGYSLRAYTRLMRNYSPMSFASQPVELRYSPDSEMTDDDSEPLSCIVEPWGGGTRGGELSSITAAVHSAKGKPVSGQAVRILSGRGDTIATASTSLSGFATMSFVPEPGPRWRRGNTLVGTREVNTLELPDVVVKARRISQNPTQLASKDFYGFKARNRETIDSRGYVTLLDIMRDMPSIIVAQRSAEEDKVNDVNRRWVIKATRGAATLSGTDEMVLILDGEECESENYDMILDLPASSIESVEYLNPAESFRYAKHPINGAVNVVTRRYAIDNKLIPSKGVIATPYGLTQAPAPRSGVTAPESPGRYAVLVDVISPDGRISSSIHPLQILDRSRIRTDSEINE